ncbi:unnamed protein product [Trichogramma brassicae]|uniref:Uncharacterized protein n=1 Tax=Trichogramma brassicae TaxID=86971 RepID=A0A6H5HTN3_9HYME|nr:unnamed protein product [Trichogramma brassicae]
MRAVYSTLLSTPLLSRRARLCPNAEFVRLLHESFPLLLLLLLLLLLYFLRLSHSSHTCLHTYTREDMTPRRCALRPIERYTIAVNSTDSALCCARTAARAYFRPCTPMWPKLVGLVKSEFFLGANSESKIFCLVLEARYELRDGNKKLQAHLDERERIMGNESSRRYLNASPGDKPLIVERMYREKTRKAPVYNTRIYTRRRSRACTPEDKQQDI